MRAYNDAIVLAAAGLMRLGLDVHIRNRFSPSEMLPAAGQGALAIEVRNDRADLLAALARLAHRRTWLVVTAERAVSRCLGGNCSVPLAAYGRFDGECLSLEAGWGDPEGHLPLLHAHASAMVHDFAAADRLGQDIANRLLAAGVCHRLHTSDDVPGRRA